jgi:hypothetical protein
MDARGSERTSCVCDNIDERIQRLVVVGLLGKTLANLLHGACDLRHVQLQERSVCGAIFGRRLNYLEVTHDLLESIAAGPNNLLDDVAEIVNQEVQRLAVLSDGTKLGMSASLSKFSKLIDYSPVHLRHQ